MPTLMLMLVQRQHASLRFAYVRVWDMESRFLC